MATRKEITEFDGLCDRLSRNDPETKVVDVNVLIRGCCPRLGDALAHNTNVTQVSSEFLHSNTAFTRLHVYGERCQFS
jgi:hypothetical protein